MFGPTSGRNHFHDFYTLADDLGSLPSRAHQSISECSVRHTNFRRWEHDFEFHPGGLRQRDVDDPYTFPSRPDHRFGEL